VGVNVFTVLSVCSSIYVSFAWCSWHLFKRSISSNDWSDGM